MSHAPSDIFFEATLQQAYAAARAQAGPGACVVLLHMGAGQCGMAVGTGAQAEVLKSMPLGLERTAREYFKTTPPTPLAMENAIQVVEDVVMPLRALIPQGAQLFSADTAVQEIALLSGVRPDLPQTLWLEAMERTFNRLSAVVEGSPAGHQGLPVSNRFAVALLILREFMHHLQFAQVVVVRDR